MLPVCIIFIHCIQCIDTCTYIYEVDKLGYAVYRIEVYYATGISLLQRVHYREFDCVHMHCCYPSLSNGLTIELVYLQSDSKVVTTTVFSSLASLHVRS